MSCDFVQLYNFHNKNDMLIVLFLHTVYIYILIMLYILINISIMQSHKSNLKALATLFFLLQINKYRQLISNRNRAINTTIVIIVLEMLSLSLFLIY